MTEMPKKRPKSRWKRTLGHVAGSAAILVVAPMLALLPLDAASGLSAAVFRGLGPRLRRSARTRRNLRLVMPELDDAAVEAIVRDVWDNLGRVFAEYAHMDAFDAFTPGGRLEVVGHEVLAPYVEAGRPLIYCSAHIGNWELAGIAAKVYGTPLNLVYRPANNPLADWLMRWGRRHSGIHLLPKGAEGARGMIDVLKRGGFVGILVDQKLSQGVPVPFFGRPAMTSTAPAALAKKYGAALVMARVVRLSGSRLRVEVEPPFEPDDTGDRQADILSTTQKINDTLERWIRERPGQWVWLHRRWPDS